MVVSDPPYNVPIAGHVCGLGEIQHREFAWRQAKCPRPNSPPFTSVFRHLAAHRNDGANHSNASIGVTSARC
jgi:hypothetical protein